MKFHLPKRAPRRFRVTDQPSLLTAAKKLTLGREQILSDRISLRPAARYHLLLKAEVDSDRSDAALVVFNTDPPVPPDQAGMYFPRYTEPVGAPFAFIGKAGEDGVVEISFTAPPNVSELVLGLRRWAAGGRVRVASVVVVQAETEDLQYRLVEEPNALQGASYIVLSRRETSFGDVPVEAGERYVVSALVENDTGRRDAALLTFTPDVAISAEEAGRSFPRFTPAVGKPFAFIDPSGGAGIVSMSFIAPVGARRVAIGARRWADGGTVRIGNRMLAVNATADSDRERSILLPLPSRAVELSMTPVMSPFLAQFGRFNVTVDFLDGNDGKVPHGPDRAGYRFSRMVLRSPSTVGGNDAALCAPEFICAPSDATAILARVSGSDAHLLPSVDIAIRDILPTLADEPAALIQRLTFRQTELHEFLFGREALPASGRQTLRAEADAASSSLTAVRSALAPKRAGNLLRREKDAAKRPKSADDDTSQLRARFGAHEPEPGSPHQATEAAKHLGRRMRILFVSPRAFGLMATPGTYQLVEAYARYAQVRVVANTRRDVSQPIVHLPDPGLDLEGVPFGAPGYMDRIVTIGREFNPDVVCLTNFGSWHGVAERLRSELTLSKFVLDIKSPLISGDDPDARQKIQSAGTRVQRVLDLVLSRCREDVESWIPQCTLPIKIYPLGVQLNAFFPRRRPSNQIKCSRFVFIGSYNIRRRQLDRLIEFIALLPNTIRAGVTFDMFGDGPGKQELIELVRANQLEPVVRINGALAQTELFKILPDYDAGLAWVPRLIYDAAPSLKILEYFGSGLPVVASATTAHRRDVDEGFRAILFEESSQSFAEAIRHAAEIGFERTDIEQNQELIKSRDWDKVVTGYLLPAFWALLAAAEPSEAAVSSPSPPHVTAPVAPNLRASPKSRRRLRILMITPRPFGLLGTPGTYRLAGAYARHADVCVIANRQSAQDQDIVHRPAEDVPVHVIPFGTRRYLRTIGESARRFDPDIVWIGNYNWWGDVLEHLKKVIPNAKLVLDVKTPLLIGEDETEVRRRIHDEGQRHACLLDLVLGLNANDIETWIPGYAGPLKEYPLGVPVVAFSPRLRTEETIRCRRFVFIGSYAQGRKLDALIELISGLPASLKTETTFDMYGGGPEKDRLRQLVETNGLANVVRVNDALSQQELFNKLSEYDAGIGWVPRELYDGSPPLKTLEYIGSGLVPIVTDTAAHRRYEREGFTLVKFSEGPASFSQAISDALAIGFPAEQLRRNLELLKGHDIDLIASEHHIRAYRQLVGFPASEDAPGAVPAELDHAAPAGLDHASTAGTYDRVLLWSPDLTANQIAAKPQSRLRIACILGDRLFEGLAHEAELLLLTQATWKQTLKFGRAEIVLVESAWATCTGDWYMAQLPGGQERERLADLLAFARSLAIPTVFWMTEDHEYLHLYQDFAARFDRVFCADPRTLTGLAKLGVRATLLPPAIQPRRFNPIGSSDDRLQEKPGVVFDGSSDLFKFPEIREVLTRLPAGSLSIIDTAAMIARVQVSRIPEPQLQQALKGWVHRRLLPAVYKRADAYISFSQSNLPSTRASWALIEAAACRAPPIHLGMLDADDFRANFVRQWRTPQEFLADIGEVAADPLAREVAAHQAWREAHGKHSFADRLAVICREIGVRYDWEPFPRVTLVTGTMRPHLLEKSIKQYLDQTYPNKELVIVFNGRLDELGVIRAKYGQRLDIVFTALPSDRYAGSLLNFGVRQGTGQYFFRIDDDDHYGPNYIYDCMLYLRASDVDIFGKCACFFHFEGEQFVYQRPIVVPKIVQFAAKDLDINRRRLLISGCSFACKADLLKTITYPDNINLSADTELLNRIRAARPDTQCLMVDSLNLVVERSADVNKHTWRQPAARLKQDGKMLDKTIADLMV